ncbi:MAG: hypothetical protein E7459_08595, partial [Ruminococcaceae bacterium]|nr:hypothetical protein [Oscillospiraceae bacterium]
MKYTSKRIFAMLLALVMSIACLVSPAMANPAEAQTSAPQDTMMQATYTTADGETHIISEEKDTTETRILVAVEDGETVFLQTSDLELAMAGMPDQRAMLVSAQNAIEMALATEIEIDEQFSLVFNGFSFTGESWMIDAINRIDGLYAMEDIEFQLVEPTEEEENIDLTPQMATSTSMTGATIAWDLGYTGEGMVVGVIDTGIKQTHEAFSVAPKNPKIDEAYLDEVFEKYGDVMHGKNPDGAYYSAKMPYGWDYFDGDHIPNHPAATQNHGSHVAGIVAGNNGKDFKGIAPDAQIIPLQVFNKTGGAAVTDMLSAMEDAVYLGVDAINMSLGIANGFETYSWPMDFAPVYEALEKAGVAVCVAASNDAHAYVSTTYGHWAQNIWQWLASNPDNGLIGCPGTYVGSFTVGNTTNHARTSADIFMVNGKEIVPKSAYNLSSPTFELVPAGTYDIINAGNGTPEEIAAAGGAEGKIILTIRGGEYNGETMTFGSKVQYAQEAGALGVLVYNNVIGTANPGPAGTLPFGFLTLTEGQAIINSMADGKHGTITLKHSFSYKVATMASSSSWGPTAQLHMKPDISAPGNKIISVDGTTTKPDNVYVSKTGTSMATPAVAGGILLLKQYLKTVYPNATATELTELAYAIMMSTAGQANAFVRQQGAGVIDMEKALATKAYLTTTENKRPKLELDDSENGEFTFSFNVHNDGNADKTYDITLTALTEETFTAEHQGYFSSKINNKAEYMTPELCKLWGGYWLVNPTPETVTLANGTIKDVTDWCTLEGDKTVTVKPGEVKTLTFTLKAGEELMRYFKENCTSGMYLEGWVKLIDQSADNGVDLSIPYLGFVGDWDYPAMIDEGWWWQDDFGVNNMSQMYTSNVHGGIFLGYGDAEQGLGLNYYWDETGETYLADRNAISPNGDGMLDAVTTVEFSLLRQPRNVKFYLEYEDGSQYTFYEKSYSFRRETHPVGMASSSNGLGYSGLYWEYAGNDLEENETVNYVVETYLDHDEFKLEDNKQARIAIPFTKDTIAPVVTAIDGGVEIQDANYVAYYAIYTDARHTDLVFEDGVFAMERGVKETYKTNLNKYFVAVADYARNEAFYYVEDGVAYKLDGEGFDHGRTIVGETHRKYRDSTDYDETYAWWSITENLDRMPKQLTPIETTSDDLKNNVAGSDVIGVGRAANGTVYAGSLGFLYTMNPETFEKEKIGRFSYPGESKTAMLAFGVAPGTNDLYGIATHSGNAFSKTFFVSINPETAEVTHLWAIKISPKTGFDFYDSDTIIMLADVGFKLINIADGSVEETLDLGYVIKTSSGTGTRASAAIGGHVGYTSSLLYDNEKNCVYLGGNYSYNRQYRSYENVVIRCELDGGQITFMQTGMNKGIGLMALTFLDEIMEIPEQEHITYIKEVVEGDCLTEGYTLRVCAECGKEFKENITEAKGHDYESVVTEPTCTEGGYTTYTCKVCGHSYVSDKTEAKGHDYEAVVTAPTCTTLGYTTYTCANCGDSYKDDYTPNTDHVYGEWETVTAPTCNAKGQEKRTCVCGAAEYRDTDMTGHNYKAEVTAPTCTTLGYTTYTCTVCGDTYKSDFVETIGHKYTEEVVAPTCTDMGYTIFTCHC